ncbi:MAG: 50S ribosomal protein L29 [Candidatus Komeilibacteria bacterium]|nr:50S ribosomal protein L29 [Candidatus Komeilibacteria bacterium]
MEILEIKELRTKTEAELRKLLSKFREQMRDQRFAISASQLKNHQVLKKTKQVVARIMTILKEKSFKQVN